MESNTNVEIFNLIMTTQSRDSIQLKKGDYLFKEGEKDNQVYFIHSGELKILKKRWVLWLAEKEEFVGISSFFSDDSKYCFSARATMDCSIYRIPNSTFQEVLISNAHVSRFIMNLLCDRIQRTNIRTRSLMEQSSKHRLIRELLAAARKNSNAILNFSIDEMAEIVGVSSRLIRKILSELEQKGFILRTKKNLIILDLRGLEIIGKINI